QDPTATGRGSRLCDNSCVAAATGAAGAGLACPRVRPHRGARSVSDHVVLNAGGKSVELPVLKATLGHDCVDVSRLTRETGLFTYDSGFTATASCKSAITYIDGDEGVLLYR